MKSVISGLVFALVLGVACGGEGEPEGYWRTDDDGNLVEFIVEAPDADPASDLGVSRAPFTSKTSGSGGFACYTHGVQTGTANGRCSCTSTTQSCRMPGSKAILWKITAQTGTTAAEVSRVRGKVNSGISALFSAGLVNGGPPLGWSFGELTGAGTPTLAIIVNGAASSQICSGSGVDMVKNACIIASNTTALTNSLPGAYVKADVQTLHIDLADIDTLGSTAAADEAHLTNAVRSGLLRAMGRGIGPGVAGPSDVVCGQSTLSIAQACVYTPADICSLSTVNQNNTTSYAVGPAGDCSGL